MSVLKQISLLIILLVVSISDATAQENHDSDHNSYEIGLEVQAYPTGVIPGIRLEKFLSDHSSLNFRLGYQFINHRDLGVQDDEKGNGYGFSLGYRHFFTNIDKGFSLGFRTDIWWNTMDWENEVESGTTNITVLQPTLIGEYTIKVSDHFIITPSLTFGWEWNVKTDGLPTGEGAIVLVGCTFGFRG